MDSPQCKRFPHRHNRDGLHDSICLACYATVASVQAEADLALFERGHVCDELLFYFASQARPDLCVKGSKAVA
jgi:hypothetical protein